MSKIFRSLILSKNVITYQDDIAIQSQTKHEMFKILDQNHQILLKENLKAVPHKPKFVLTHVKFLGHIIEGNKITPIKSQIDAILKIQTP